MKHNIRQRQLDPNTGLIVTKIVKVESELGSGVLDKNGREIFEGDIVKNTAGNKGVVTFNDGRFYVNLNNNYGEQDLTRFYSAAYLEVVGHAEED